MKNNKNIIFDLGGVLLTEAESNLKKAITNEWNVDFNFDKLPKIFNKTFNFINTVLDKDCKKLWLMGKMTAEEIIASIDANIEKKRIFSFF